MLRLVQEKEHIFNIVSFLGCPRNCEQQAQRKALPPHYNMDIKVQFAMRLLHFFTSSTD